MLLVICELEYRPCVHWAFVSTVKSTWTDVENKILNSSNAALHFELKLQTTSCKMEGWDPPLERVPHPVAVAVAPS